mmetsp:Transcript_8497/g.21824  ORF Transcript_8497/g.21824 Transcript_8497/m.21824 type:complete len:135 (+) Transcript_8497:61-465(+)
MSVAVRTGFFLSVLGAAKAFRPVAAQAAQHASRCMATSATFSIDDAVAAKDVVIFSKSFCPFCAKSKTLFRELGVDADIYELDKRDDGSDIQAALKEKTGQSTVPNIFIKGEHLGGNDDAQKAKASGDLEKMLA